MKIPKELIRLIDSGWWPTMDNVQALVPPEKVKRISQIDDKIYFFPPPFRIVAENVKDNPSFWESPIAATHEIDIDKAIDIGDFGLGSDSPILLDYRRSNVEPSVIFLKYGETNHWHQCASTFKDFLDILEVKYT